MPALSLTTTARILVIYNPRRKSIAFSNPDSTAIFYLRSFAISTVTVTSSDFDYVVLPKGVTVFDETSDGPDVLRGRFDGISDTVSKTIGVAETLK